MYKFYKEAPTGIKFLIYYLIIGLLLELIRQIAIGPLQANLFINIIIAIAITWFMIWGLLKGKNWMRILVSIATIKAQMKITLSQLSKLYQIIYLIDTIAF